VNRLIYTTAVYNILYNNIIMNINSRLYKQRKQNKTKRENTSLILRKSFSPVRWCPSRCWWAWLFRTTQMSCAAGRPWTASQGACTADVERVGRLYLPPTTMICGKRTGTVCCPLARYQWVPNTFGLDPTSGSTRAT